MSERPKIAAIYARYSSDRQSPTSIEDQVRQCKELAAREGYEVPETYIFADRAITGTRDGLNLRDGFADLMNVIKDRQVQCVIIDEVSRVGRDTFSLAVFIERLKKQNIRLLVYSNSLDSESPSFTLSFGLLTTMAAQESENTRHRTKRGMLGVLERGGMVGYPPFGYRMVPRLVGVGGLGATFEIDQEQAQWVRHIFETRAAGVSYYEIAKEMQVKGVPIPGTKRREDGGFWRAGTVKQLLRNTVYKGVFSWNASNFAVSKAKKLGKPLQPVMFARPQLRIIDDELWQAAQAEPGKNQRKGYRHAYNRRVTCGVCSSSCSLKYRGSVVLLTCGTCDTRRRMLAEKNHFSQISVRALNAVIADIFKRLEPLGVLEAYKTLLVGFANNDHQEEIDGLKKRAQDVDKRIATVAKMLSRQEGDAFSLSDVYERLSQEKDKVSRQLEQLERVQQQVSPETIEKHVEGLNPLWYLQELFERQLDPARANQLVRRIFPEILFRKIDKNTSRWLVTVNLQEISLSDKPQPMSSGGWVTFEYQVKCIRRTPTSYEPNYLSHAFRDSPPGDDASKGGCSDDLDPYLV